MSVLFLLSFRDITEILFKAKNNSWAYEIIILPKYWKLGCAWLYSSDYVFILALAYSPSRLLKLKMFLLVL